MKKLLGLVLILFLSLKGIAQAEFNFEIQLQPINVPNFPGLHSFAFGQHDNKWILIGGRLDGIHARQPFNAFPANQNNASIFVIDVATAQLWTAPLASLPTGIREQLQSTNMNFYQDSSTLYIIGGYAFSPTANDHITFPRLTSIDVPGLMNAVQQNQPITPYFKQISNSNFANTGGQLGKLGATFYLVGGHRFDGRYNPMGNPTFTQTYSNQIRKFTIDNSGDQLSFGNYEAITDPIHLRRRGYNLVPQVFPDGTLGYTISSGVFQINADLPFLYPVDIKPNGYFPQTSFNQYLSNYHSGKVGLFEAGLNKMHSLFFGGLSQYYYQNGTLIQDNAVPFVRTISRVTRLEDGTLLEFVMPEEMPALHGAGAEFIPNLNLPHYANEVIQLDVITEDEFVIGHLVGGIHSNSLNPFSNNNTSSTSASATIYEVKLIRTEPLNVSPVNGTHPFDFKISPNPTTYRDIHIEFDLPYIVKIDYFITSIDGKIMSEGEIVDIGLGKNKMRFDLQPIHNQTLLFTFIVDDKFYVTKKIMIK